MKYRMAKRWREAEMEIVGGGKETEVPRVPTYIQLTVIDTSLKKAVAGAFTEVLVHIFSLSHCLQCAN